LCIFVDLNEIGKFRSLDKDNSMGALSISYARSRPANDGSSGPDVISITLGATVWDHPSRHSHKGKTTSALDRLAKTGIRLRRAVSPDFWALPADTSPFAVFKPSHHGTHAPPNEAATPEAILKRGANVA
jgi:arylsulfatase A-like enzyme